MMAVPLPLKTTSILFSNSYVDIEVTNWNDPTGIPGSTVYTIPYLVDDFILAFMYLRFYFLLQTMIALSPPNNSLAGKRVCHEHSVLNNFPFQLRTAFRERPYTVFLVTTGFFMVTFAMLIRIFERPYYRFNFPDIDYQYFDSFSNSIWYVIITVSSVGFGDIYAVTPMGRILTVFAVLVGVIFLSTMVALITSSL